MKIINFWVHTNRESCNTNNCYHEYLVNTLYVYLFGFSWVALSWRHNTVSFHDRNEQDLVAPCKDKWMDDVK